MKEVQAGRLVVNEREHLLELVDHEDEFGAVGGQQPQDGPVEPVLVAFELVHEAGGG
jgi:hypothetical protein